MAEKLLSNYKSTHLLHESNNRQYSERSKNVTANMKHKVTEFSRKPFVTSRVYSENYLKKGREKDSETEPSDSEKNFVTPIKRHISHRKAQNNGIGSNGPSCSLNLATQSESCSQAHSSRCTSTVTKFVPSSTNVAFFKQLWEGIVNRYPEWVQRTWRKRLQQRWTFLQQASTVIGDKSTDNTKNAEQNVKDGREQLTAISEEDQNFSPQSASECILESEADVIDESDLNAVHRHVEQSSFHTSIRSSLGSRSYEFSEERGKVIEWKEWSLQLTSDGKLIITGKSEQNTVTKSQDVCSWIRVDAHTLRHRKDGTVYKLVGSADHFVCQDLPSYVRTKFQYGFPEKWLDIKNMWLKYRKQGNPSNFVWSPDTDYNRSKQEFDKTFPGTKPGNKNRPSIQNTFTQQKNAKLFSREVMKDLSNVKHQLSHSLSSRAQERLNNLEKEALNSVQQPVVVITKLSSPHLRQIKHPNLSFGIESDTIGENSTSRDLEKSSDNDSEYYINSLASHSGKKMASEQAGRNGIKSKSQAPKKKENNEPKLLRNWYPILSGKHLKLSGFMESSQSNVKHTTRAIVTANVVTNIIVCVSGERYQLVGALDENACAAPDTIKKKLTKFPYRWKKTAKQWQELVRVQETYNETSEEETDTENGGAAPDTIKKKLTKFPHHWKKTAKQWQELVRVQETYNETSEEENDTENGDIEVTLESLVKSGNLKKSTRGRILVPPLKHWTGTATDHLTETKQALNTCHPEANNHIENMHRSLGIVFNQTLN